ncbi:MAG: DoxX family protein [Corynebacteriales bacterium]|uniref:DoxX family protein n=1 Tax=Williamsia herbipolensis TaxID=1603258 RepID=A0AAU4K0S4_9NOCA|nr:DoxX family protein [Williamsia herbipolensis]MCX6469093.1 DoxX family protein [Mycobacteriales bacterium]
MNTTVPRDIALLLARVGVGVVFLAHGLQKLDVWGYAGTKTAFAGMGAPVPGVSAFLATWVEILGGIALIAGLLTPIFAILLVADMIGAYFIAHIGNGIWISDGGYELVLGLGAAALVIAAVGAGRFSVDGALGTRLPWTRRTVAAERERVTAA